MKYRITEMFASIQGEGHYTGTPAIFIRFSGCNLSCYFCDTDHSFVKEMTAEEIISEIEKTKIRYIVLTGGEPTLQIDDHLISKLRRTGCFIQIETNGTSNDIPKVDWVTCSPKENFILTHGNELKVVYFGQEIEGYLREKFDHFYLQPCSCENTNKVIEIVKNDPRWRLSIQLQKLLKIR